MFSPAKFWHYSTDPSLPYSTEICFKFCTVVLITELLSWFVKPKSNLVLIFPIRQVTCTDLCDPWPFCFFLASLVFYCIHEVLYYFMISLFYRQYPWAVSTNQRNKIFAEELFTICLSKENWHGESRSVAAQCH